MLSLSNISQKQKREHTAVKNSNTTTNHNIKILHNNNKMYYHIGHIGHISAEPVLFAHNAFVLLLKQDFECRTIPFFPSLQTHSLNLIIINIAVEKLGFSGTLVQLIMF